MAKNSESFSERLKRDNPAHILGFLLKSLQHTLRQRFDEALRKQGVELSYAQFAALFNLHGDPGVTGGQLARRAMVSAQTMNSALHALERDGYIERRPHPRSRRADSWTLTEAGLEELDRARQVGSAIFARMLDGFEAAETAAFEDYLRRCISALDGDSVALATESKKRAPARSQRRQNAGVNNTRNV
jgi:DNA-binding MarR family transcriptional regulator